MHSTRSSSTEAARERRRQKGEAQAVPLPTTTTTDTTPPPPPTEVNMQSATMNERSELTFDEMVKRELDYVMDQEIKEALNKIRKRQTALMAQESSLIDAVKDELGHDSDFYENLVDAVQRNDPRVGDTKEQIYEYLAEFEFTRMRSLEALHEMYPVSDKEQQQQQPEPKSTLKQQQEEEKTILPASSTSTSD